MRLLAPFGFYGWGNIGDESTLQWKAQAYPLLRGGFVDKPIPPDTAPRVAEHTWSFHRA